ncbi:MAG TPA: RNA polymerase sigma-70 factor [Puia sp.]|nr:RNA polymerase sigma-70 factor [Puia sp.]
MSSPEKYTDRDLFRLIALGDEPAFAELFRRYDRRIYPFVLKMIKSPLMAEEIAQEIFIKIWRHRETLHMIDQPESYILTIAARHTLDQIKKRLNENRMLQRFSAGLSATHNDPEELLLLKDTEELIQRAVDQLPPQQKSVYLLSRRQGMSYEEIGGELNISPNTVRNHLVKALAAIRVWLEQQDRLPLFLLCCAHLLWKN